MRSFFMKAAFLLSGVLMTGNLIAQSELWGTISSGGEYSAGTIIKTDGDGNNFAVIDTFHTELGANPVPEIMLANDGYYYGVTSNGGIGLGVLFRYDAVNEVYTNLHSFVMGEGWSLQDKLMQASNGKLYGLARAGGLNNAGTLFEFDLTLNTLTILVDFEQTTLGKTPIGGLIEVGSEVLYGVTYDGGANNGGVLFKYDIATDIITNLYDFGTDGTRPNGGLLQASNGKLYGLTANGGANGFGVIYEWDVPGLSYSLLYDFDGTNGNQPIGKMTEHPNGKFYGTAFLGGINDEGVVFEYDPVGDAYMMLHEFTSLINGSYPRGDLEIGQNGLLYGVTLGGGANNGGVLYSYDIVTSSLVNLFDLDASTGTGTRGKPVVFSAEELIFLTYFGGSANQGTIVHYNINSGILNKTFDFGTYPDGKVPLAPILGADGFIYGTTKSGGLHNGGTIYKMDPSANIRTKLYDFIDGINPSELFQAGNGLLYGVCQNGGANNGGILYEFDPGIGILTVLHEFDAVGSDPMGSNPKGAVLEASNGMLYGVTYWGGTSGYGTLYQFDRTTSTHTKLVDFVGANGYYPEKGLMEASNGLLYGTTYYGGTNGSGCIYSFNTSTNTLNVEMSADGIVTGTNPRCRLIEGVDGLLYGTMYQGGASPSTLILNNNGWIMHNSGSQQSMFIAAPPPDPGKGTLFSLDPSTSAFNVLVEFDGTNKGRNPQGDLMQASNGKIYGFTWQGGINNEGVLFEYVPSTTVFTKKIDLELSTGNNPLYNSLIEISTCAPSTNTITTEVCDIYTVPSGDETYSTVGSYTVMDTIPNYCGADSVLTINLTLNQSTSGTDVQTACMSFTWIDGITYSTSNNSATWTLMNAAGCDSLVTLDLTIGDFTAPVADAATLPNITSECEVVSLTVPTATDNCAGSINGTHNATLPITAQGTTVVTWTFDDGNGNTSTQTQNIVIDDVTAPVADAASLTTVTGECTATVTGVPTATDNCVGSVTGTTTDPLTYTSEGTYTVTWTFDDGNGNTSTQTQTVVIDDVTAPVADVATLADELGECSATPTAPTATDNCMGTITGTPDVTFPITAQGTTVVTWTYDDGNGNTSTQTQNVILTDVTAPVPDAASLADVTDPCSVTSLIAPTATDNCSAVTVTNDATFPITATTTVTWLFSDASGNASTQTQNVIITDATAPTASNLTGATVECVGDIPAPDATLVNDATDNCTAVPTVTWTSDVSDGQTCPETITRTYTVSDDAGNTFDVTQVFIVQDITAPTASNPSTLTVQCIDNVPAPSTSWVNDEADNCSIPTVTWVSDVSDGQSCPEMITRTFNVADDCGNNIDVVQLIVVNDLAAPIADVASLPTETAYCDVTLTAPTATDNCSGSITGTTTTTFPINTLGTTTVTWTFTDNCGNSSTQTQDVVIEQMETGTWIANDGITIVSSNLEPGVTYQWINCADDQPINGATNHNYTPTAGGDFAVVTTIAGCSDTSDCVHSVVGIKDLTTVEIQIYPNPTNDGVLFINYDGQINAIEVMDMTGRKVSSSVVIENNKIDASKLSMGNYLIHISTNEGVVVKEVTIVR